jgi:hypothetical protein
MSTKSKFLWIPVSTTKHNAKEKIIKKTLEFLTSPGCSRMISINWKKLFPMHFDSQFGSKLFRFITSFSASHPRPPIMTK